ncbi:unnamed protein product [Tuber aestivum]|uniref:Uncharacterized protein n=1 Tax=Tuber aestivum TaxID=59557 RepID=A0A292Q4X2_9PEZI|nr:unnamed protein product [Tuber aestivum]
MAEIPVWQTSAFFPPAPLPCGYFCDAEEIRHQEHLHRVSHAQFLYSHRTDSPEAMRVYRDFLREQNAWMAEQEELREREAQRAMKVYMDLASRWAEEWRRLESGETVEDSLIQTAAAHILNSLFEPDHPGSCADPIPWRDGSTPESISPLNLPESLIDWKKSRNSCKGLPRVKAECTLGDFPGFNRVDGSATTKIQNPVLDPAKATRKPQQNLEGQVRCKSLGPGGGRSSGLDRRLGTNKSVVQPIISSPPPGLGPPKKCRAASFNTSKPPSPMTSIVRQDRGLVGGEIIKICSHKRWTDGGYLLYETLWRPYGIDIPPLRLWVKSDHFVDVKMKILLADYHSRNKLGTVHSKPKRGLQTSGSLGVKEIRDALDERKLSLIASGRYNDRTAGLLGKCRWMMRGEWQQRGRGWAAAIEVAERWRQAWQDADKAEGQIRLNLEREAAPAAPEAAVNADRNGITCSKEVKSKVAPSPPVVFIDSSPSLGQRDGEHAIDSERDHSLRRISRDPHKVTRNDEEEWRSFFGGIDCLDPVVVDVTDSSTIGGISESGGITRTFPDAVETWRIGRSGSLTPEVRNMNRTKGGFINLLKQDRFTRKSISEAASTPVSVHSVSERGSYLAHERETIFSRLFIKDGYRGGSMDAATPAAYKPILQPSGVTEAPGVLGGTSAAVSRPLDGETHEGHPGPRNEVPPLNYTATQEEVGGGDGRAQAAVAGGILTRDVATQTSSSTESLARLGIGQSVIMSTTSTRTIGEQLDDDWRVRFLNLFSHTPGLSNLLAGARAYTGDCGLTQAAEYVHGPVESFGGGSGHLSSLGREEATEGDPGGHTGHKKENGPKNKKHKRGMAAESGRNPDPPPRLACPQLLAPPQDGVPLPPDEVRGQGGSWSIEESLVQGVPPAEGGAPTKQELVTKALNDSKKRAKARGKELKSKKQEEGLTREEYKEYKKLKRLLVRYQATRWFLGQVDILIERHRR